MNPNQSFTGLKKSTQNAFTRPCCVKCKEPLEPLEPLSVKIKDPQTPFTITKDVLLSMKNTSLTVTSRCNEDEQYCCLDFGEDTAANALCIQKLLGLTEEGCCVVLNLNVFGTALKLGPNATFIQTAEDLLEEGSHKLRLCAENVTQDGAQIFVNLMPPFVNTDI